MVALALTNSSGFADRVLDLLDRVDYRRADAPEEREAIFSLRYGAYLREGAIAPNMAQRFADDYDEAPNAWIFGVYIDGQLASSIRLTIASPGVPQMPALTVFSDILSPALERGGTIVDPTRFVTDAEASRAYPGLSFVTTRLAWAATEYFNADLLLATVRKEHQAYYKRVFGHRLICDARPYPKLQKPISLMAVDYLAEKDKVQARYPFFRSNAFERRMLFERPGMPERARTPLVAVPPLVAAVANEAA
jgi:hypothetical protein